MSIQRKNLLKTGQEENQNQKKGRTESFAINVTAYDLEKGIVAGERLDTGEAVHVKLREITNNGKFKRPEVSSFADQKSKTFTDVGGTLLVEGAFKASESDGTSEYSARWLTSLSHRSGEAYTFPHSLVSLKVVETPAKKFGVVTIVPTEKWTESDYEVAGIEPPATATSIDELRPLIQKALESSGKVGLCCHLDDGGEKIVDAIGLFAKPKAENKGSFDAEDAMKHFDGNLSKNIEKMFAAGGSVRVVQVCEKFVGPLALEGMEKDAASGPKNGAINQLRDGKFANGIVTVRPHKYDNPDEGLYVTHVVVTSPTRGMGDEAFIAATYPEYVSLAAQSANNDEPTVSYDADHSADASAEPAAPADEASSALRRRRAP